jgi:hypothetical protein
MNSATSTVGGTERCARLVNALPWLWLGMSAAWAVVIVATDQLAWPLALWIATTVGPLTALKTRLDPQAGPQRDRAVADLSTIPTKETNNDHPN